jgi:PAS domain S-box-containing protein
VVERSESDTRGKIAERLRASEERLRLALEGANAGLWDVSFDPPHSYWSPEYRALYGFTAHDPPSPSTWEERIHPDDVDRVRQTISSALASDVVRYELEFRICHPQKGERWILDLVRIRRADDGRPISTGGINLDVTARKRAAEELRASEERLRLAADVADFGTFDRDLVRGTHIWSPGMYRLAGLPEGAPVPLEQVIRLVHPRHREELEAAYARAFDPAGTGEIAAEYRFFRPDGQERWASIKGRTFFEGEGVARRAVRLIGAGQDITERKRSEAALQELNARLEDRVAQVLGERDLVWRLGRDLLVVLQPNGRVEAVNPAVGLLGYRVEEVVGRHVADFIYPDDQEMTGEIIMRGAAESVEGIEGRICPREGRPRWYSWTISPAEGLVVAVGRDVDAEKQREKELEQAREALRQSQKLEAIGHLTGGVAHDFNNLLTVIRSSADLLRRQELSDEKRRRYIDAISDTADRGAKLTGQLLAFARRQTLKPEVFDVGERLTQIADILRTIVGSNIRLTEKHDCAGCFIEADPNQFETAIINLAVNARDAMNGQGELKLSLRTVDSIPARPGYPSVKGDFVALGLADTGVGVPAEQLGRIFEPFFTTKEQGKGTGLGLSQVYGFTKQSGGEVHVESKVGQGATFTLYLPRATPSPICEDAKPVTSDIGSVDTRRVLVVEDNADVGDFATLLLTDLGYAATRAGNAQAALDLLGSEPGRFDVVFTDVVMPGMSGLELARELGRRMPDMPVVLTSGYSHVLAEEGTHGFELLQKPYTVEGLARVLRRALRSSGKR